MGRIALFLALCALGCYDYRAEAPPRADGPTEYPASVSATRTCSGDETTRPVDTAASVVRWRGTKFAGRGMHEGTVRLSGGTLNLCDGALVGGQFTLDMASIAVTDIPVTDCMDRSDG